MKQMFVLSVMLLFPAVAGAQMNRTDSFTIATYYPSPYGVYRNLRLFPTNQPAASSTQQAGTMYYNGSERTVYINDGADWKQLGAVGWEVRGNDLVNTNPGNVSIGVANPDAVLKVSGSVVVDGGVKVGMSTTCNAAAVGTLRFNATANKFQYCAGGGSWTEFGGGQGTPGSCGTAAKTYAYTATAFSGTFCSSGNPDPAPTNIVFPGQGGSRSWACVSPDGGSNATCTASRGTPPVVTIICEDTDSACLGRCLSVTNYYWPAQTIPTDCGPNQIFNCCHACTTEAAWSPTAPTTLTRSCMATDSYAGSCTPTYHSRTQCNAYQ